MLAPLVRPGLSLESYLLVLDFFQRFYEQLQPALYKALRQFDCDYPLGDRLAWLDADLKALGHANSLPALGMEPLSLTRPAQWVGCLYVVEGSTLGGQVIARQLRALLGLDATHGARFFHGWGEETDTHWGDFWRFAGVHCPSDHQELAISSALDLFARIEEALETIHASRR